MNLLKKLSLVTLLSTVAAIPAAPAAAAAPPDYGLWADLLTRYYDPAHGMNYKALKAQDGKKLAELRKQLAAVDPASLSRHDQLAYWINLYNVSTLGVVVAAYPIKSIRDLSTDPIIRLNVFKKPSVQTKAGAISLNDVENDKIRAGFKDPRIHFAINCAAESCPPMRSEPFVGDKIDAQLDDQARKFLNGPRGLRLEADGDGLQIHVSKILDWFGDDFEKWGGGKVAFISKYASPDKKQRIDKARGKIDFEYDDYSWKLNDASK